MLPISVCLIAKNEEKHIEECLRRLQPYGFEIVLADTGSEDHTIRLARKYTDRIYHYDWCDDFSAAKNFVMQKASHDWILSLDCDEYLEFLDIDALQSCMEQYPHHAGRILIRNRFTENGQTSFDRVRVSRFVNRRCYRFEGAVHEQLVPTGDRFRSMYSDPNPHMADPYGQNHAVAANRQSAAIDASSVKYVYPAPITVLHVGYDGSEEEMRKKSKRNIALLEQELKTCGADPYLYYQLGQSYRKLQDYENACRFYDLGLAMDVDPAMDYIQTMVESYGYTLLDLKRPQDALNLLGVYDEFAVRADFIFLIGLIYMNNGLFDEAICEFHKATTMEEFAVEGVNSYKANYNIGVICECRGDTARAREAYLKCGDYEPALTRLGALS